MDALKHPEKYETGETGKAGNSSSRQLKGAARQSYKTKNKDSEETGAATENPLETVTEVKKTGYYLWFCRKIQRYPENLLV